MYLHLLIFLCNFKEYRSVSTAGNNLILFMHTCVPLEICGEKKINIQFLFFFHLHIYFFELVLIPQIQQ